MNEKLSPIDGSVLEGICRVLGDTNKGLTGTEIGKFLKEVNIQDIYSTTNSLNNW